MTDRTAPAAPRAYRAVCFDLDGTLLPMDIDEFMGAYFAAIARFVAERGLDAERFMAGLKAGTRAMAVHEDDRTNAEAYWDEFYRHVDAGAADWDALLAEFYDVDFARIGEGFAPDPAAARVLASLRAKGYPLALTTMPMFPLRAVEHRLAWAGADPADFARITSYENSKAVKPKQTYYAENLAALGVAGADVLMVGNNTLEDLAFLDLGADAFLVTDWLLDPVGYDLETVRHGTMADLERWVEALPPCADPARGILRGPVPRDAMEAAFAANAVGDIDRAEAAARAAAVADDVASHDRGATAAAEGAC